MNDHRCDCGTNTHEASMPTNWHTACAPVGKRRVPHFLSINNKQTKPKQLKLLPVPIYIVTQLPFTDRLAFFSCVAKETGDLLGGSGGVQVALDTVCDAGASADTFISQGIIRDCLMCVEQINYNTCHCCKRHLCVNLIGPVSHLICDARPTHVPWSKRWTLNCTCC